jgi:pilus assembly protein CpaF
MTVTFAPPTTLEPRVRMDGWPPDEDRPVIRRLRPEVRQALGRLSGDDERGDPARVRQLIRECIDAHQRRAFSTTNTPRLIDAQAAERALVADFLGFGVLERYLRAVNVEEIGIVGPGGDWLWMTDGTKRPIDEIVCEDEADLVDLVRRVGSSLGRSFTSRSPVLDATLDDGSRLHAVLGCAFGGVSRVGTTLNIRKFPDRIRDMGELVERAMLSWPAAHYLLGGVAAYCNILIAGGFGSGKTTLANVLLASISGRDRVVSIEDPHELSAVSSLPDGIVLECRPENAEGVGRITQRDLVKCALRMRPDRICVGEIQGPEAFDVVHAMASGTSGSFSTIHAESAREALQKLGMHLLAAEPNVNERLIAEWISQSLHIVVALAKHPVTGQRALMQLSEVSGLEGTTVRLEDLWVRESFEAPLVWTGASSRLGERFRRYAVDPSGLRPGPEARS